MKKIIIFLVRTSMIWSTDWTDTQISKDFAIYEQSGITLEMIDQTMQWDAKWAKIAYEDQHDGMVRYRVIDSQIYQTQHEVTGRFGVTALRILKEIIKKYPLPDVDFVYFDQDGPVGTLIAPDQSVPLGPMLSGTKRDEHQNVILYHDWLTSLKLPPRPKAAVALRQYSWIHEIEEVEAGVKLYPWQEKLPKLLWRGTASDGKYTEATLKIYPRAVLVLLGQHYPNLIDAAFTACGVSENRALLTLQPHISIQDHLKYKYQIAIDGITATFGLSWRLLTDCLVFKVKSQVRQWFDSGLVEGVHYVPIEKDLSDLPAKILYAQEHDEESRAIAENGRKFALENIMPEDLIRYCYKVLVKYASLQRFKPTVPTFLETPEFELVASPLSEEDRSTRRKMIYD